MTKIKKMTVGVLGGGSWGTTFAALLTRNATVRIWARDVDTVEQINQQQRNPKYLGEAKLPSQMQASTELSVVLESVDVVIMAVPSNVFRDVLEQAKRYLRPKTPIVSLTKGLEKGTDFRMTQVVNDVLPTHPVGVLTGPNLAKEIMAGQSAASVLAMEDDALCARLQTLFNSGMFRVYRNKDVIGCELGGVLKNIIAIGVGMGIGIGAGDNTRAAIITRGLAEMTRLGVSLGGRAQTFSGLAGMGDLLATCISPQSRNHQVGVQLGKGRAIADIISEMVMVAEGVKSASTVMRLAKRQEIEMPITRDVCRVIDGEISPARAFLGLVKYAAGAESEPG